MREISVKKLNVFFQLVCQKQMNIWIPKDKFPGIEMLINFPCQLLNDAAPTYCEKN